jgi:polar amino acid transport system substrate-binding protein
MARSDSRDTVEVTNRRCALDSVPGFIVEVDENLVITLANSQTHNRWQSIVEGKTLFYELFFPGNRKPEDGIIEKTFNLEKYRSGEIETKEGEVFKIVTNYIEEAHAKKVVVQIVDISERVELEKKLEIISKKHHDQLLQADKMISLGILASGMAHEINNPNNSIMLNVSVLQKAWDSVIPILNEFYREKGDLRVGGMNYEKMKKKMPQLYSGLMESSKRIQRIVSDLKYFSGKDLISLKSQVDVESVVQSAKSLTGNMIHKSTRRFKAVYEKDLPNVMGNFQNLEQVIINLVQNACQALEGPENGIFITITYDRENREIVVAVKDEGVGIPEKDLKYIAEPFFTSKRSSGGTGLGLYVSSKIINDHGGTIHFVSTPGKGTTVEVRLPALDVIRN